MLIGIDIGGTFTDFVFYEPGDIPRLWTHKVLSTPSNPSDAVFQGLAAVDDASHAQVVHGSTVATNAVLEGKGARTALITTDGFADVLEIGRQARAKLYDLNVQRNQPLILREHRYTVTERVTAEGTVLQALDETQLDGLVAQLQSQEVESVAVTLLFSFLHPDHEQVIAEVLRRNGFFVSASHEILPEFREYERTSTTVVNAFVAPIVDRYMAQLQSGLGESELRIMQSNGGTITATHARQQAVRMVLSGPAGGVVGARTIGQLAGYEKLITFDMGGTSTDVSLVDGVPRITTEAHVGGHPIGVPVIDIHTVGAGGGSIAYLDAGGALRVGPQSAGANPGPAAYGKGDLPTVTDANVVLGRLPHDLFLGGQMALDVERAQAAIRELAQSAGLDMITAAQGIVEIAETNMERAARVISVERGHDPEDFALLSFGGAGGLHAVNLARRMGIKQVLIPPNAATLSAFGMLAADVIKDYSQTVMVTTSSTDNGALQARFEPMLEQGRNDLMQEGVADDAIVLERLLDMRYVGQSYEISVPFDTKFEQAFHQLHQSTHGYHDANAATEIVNLRLRAIGRTAKPVLPTYPNSEGDPSQALIATRPVVLDDGWHDVPMFDGAKLENGDVVLGPAVVVEPDTTIFLNVGDWGQVDEYHNLLIEVSV